METKKNFFNNYKHIFISIICFVVFWQLIGWTISDIITHWTPQSEVNNAVDYEALRKYLGDAYVFCFLTDHTVILAFGTGMFYAVFYKNEKYKTTFFCLMTYLVFNIFALTQFKWSSVKTEHYSSYKTLSCHLLFPITSFLLILWMRKDVLLNWRPMVICSFYLTFFFILMMSLYYSISYDKDGVFHHLKVYEFLDFNKKIMCFPTTNIGLKYFFIIGITIITPFAGMGIFIVFKFIYNVKIDKTIWFKKLSY